MTQIRKSRAYKVHLTCSKCEEPRRIVILYVFIFFIRGTDSYILPRVPGLLPFLAYYIVQSLHKHQIKQLKFKCISTQLFFCHFNFRYSLFCLSTQV